MTSRNYLQSCFGSLFILPLKVILAISKMVMLLCKLALLFSFQNLIKVNRNNIFLFLLMACNSFSKIANKTLASHIGDNICLLPVLNIISLTLVRKFNQSTEQLLNRTTTEIPSTSPSFTYFKGLTSGDVRECSGFPLFRADKIP